MKARFLTLALLLMCLGVSPGSVLAGSSLSIRLVEATNSDNPGARGVEDVASALRGSGYNTFRVSGNASVGLPASNRSCSLGGYTVKCNGKQNSLAINVSYGRDSLLDSTVDLRDNKPFIIGGMPIKNGQMILVFVVR